MSYRTINYHALKCDNCGAELNKFYTEKPSADVNSLNYGWLKTGEGKHLCPKCVVQKIKSKVVAL